MLNENNQKIVVLKWRTNKGMYPSSVEYLNYESISLFKDSKLNENIQSKISLV